MCEKKKKKFQQELCAPSQTTVALRAGSHYGGAGPGGQRSPVYWAITWRWGEMGVSAAYWAGLSLRQPKPMLLYGATYGRRDFIVLMLNCGGTSETKKLCKVIIVFRSVQVARRLTDFSIPVLTGFQKAALLNCLHAVTFKTLSTLSPCFGFFSSFFRSRF